MKSFFFLLAMILAPLSASATPIDVTIGDNDGFGYGVADNAFLNVWFYDQREVDELNATDGSQYTDSAYNPETYGPTPSFDIIFPLFGDLTSGNFTVDLHGLQFGQAGIIEILVYFNGILQEDLLKFNLTATGSKVFSVALSDDVLAAGQGTNEFVVTFGDSLWDAVGYDYFNLSGEINGAPVPVPPGFLLLLTGLACLLARNYYQRR